MDLPPEVDRFLVSYVDSVEALEIVLLLHRERARAWSAAAIAAELRLSVASTTDRLARLVDRGIAEPAPEGVRYAARGPLDASIAALADSYRDRRYTVLRRIFEKPNERVQVFADAFRIRRDK